MTFATRAFNSFDMLPRAVTSSFKSTSRLKRRRLAATFPLSQYEDQMETERLSFKEMCERFDVTPRTLRYYEYIELLTPERKGRSRFYGPKEIARMTLILRGRRFGFQLEEIRQWLLIYESEGTEAQMQKWIELADRQITQLEDEKTQLEQTLAELKNLRDQTLRTLS